MEWKSVGDALRRLWTLQSGIKTTPQAPTSLRQRPKNERLLLVLGRKACRFTSVAFSPDGRWLAAGATDGLVYVLNVRTMEVRCWLEGHTNVVTSVAFSPDGARLASGSFDNTVRLWNIESRETLQRFEGHWGRATSVAFSPDGMQLASGSLNGAVLLWDTISGVALQRLEGHQGLVTGVVYSPDGARLASSSMDCTVRLWDSASGAVLQRLEGHTDGVTSVAYSPDGMRLASSSIDFTVRLWDAVSGAALQRLEGHSGPVMSVAYSPDGARLASGSQDRTALIWDAVSGDLLHRMICNEELVVAVTYSPDGTRLASGPIDNTVRFWDTVSGVALQQFDGPKNSVTSAAYSSNGAWLAGGINFNSFRQLDEEHGNVLKYHEEFQHGVSRKAYGLSFSPLAIKSLISAVRVWDAASGVSLRQLDNHNDLVASIACNPDGVRFASGSWDKTVRQWDAANGSELQRIEGHTFWITSVVYSPDGSKLASGSYDNTVRLWDAASGAALQQLKGHTDTVTSVAYSPDGARLVSGSHDSTVRLWNAVSGATLKWLKGHKGPVTSVSYSPDSARIASGSQDKTVRLWDAVSGKALQSLEGHTDSIVSLVFTADSRWLLSLAQDRTVRLWRLADGAGAVIARVAAPWHYAPLTLAFVPDGNYASKFEDAIRIEEIRFDPATAFRDAVKSVCLSSAKVVLLGDSGVGKSTLVRRIQTGQYQPQDSTHGMELLTLAPELLDPAVVAPDGERREVVLWDLGGQEEYRLVHQLFMHDTQLALLLCDPTRGKDQYSTVLEWNALLAKQRGDIPTTKLLVGSKVDDPAALLDQAAIDATLKACQARRFIATSAKEGHGIDELKQTLADAIDWDEIARISRPALFQRIRDRIEVAREQGAVSLPLTELREQVRAAAPEEYDEAALSLVVDQLSRQGVIVDTRHVNGERELVLKLSEIERYAGSLILMAKQAYLQTGMGVPAIEESALQNAGLVFPRIAAKDRLPLAQERIVLECVVRLLIARGICIAHQGLLVFPSLYPQGECQPIDSTDSVLLYYDFTRPSDELYAQLAARAAITCRFGRVRLSAGRAEFGQREAGGLCGVQYQARGQGRGHIDIYFCPETPDDIRRLFRAFVEDFLKERGVDVREVVELRCQECQHVFAEADVRGRIENGKATIFCPDGHSTPIDAAFKDARANNPELTDCLAALKTVVDRRIAQEAQAASDKVSSATISPTSAGVSVPTPGKSLNLLHLSDLHFTADTDPVQMLQPLVADLTDQQGLKLEKLDYLVVSGDCTCIGSAEEFERVHQFLEMLIDRFGLSAQRCVLVPGNHDLSWKEKVYEWQDAGEVDTTKLPDDNFIRQGEGYLVRSAEAVYGQRFKNFATFHHQFTQQPYPLEAEKQAQVYIHDDDKIQFIGLNSSCRIDRYNKGRASIDGRALSHALMTADTQIKQAITDSRIPASDDVLRIAVWHHPITGNEKIFDDAFVQLLQQADVRLCLHGHIHENRADLIAPTHPTRKLHTIGTGSFGAVAKDRPESTPRLYNLIEIDRDQNRLRVYSRQMPKAGGAWGPNSVWPDGKGGCRHWYDIPLREG